MVQSERRTIRLHAADNVVVARAELLPGTEFPEEGLAVTGHIPTGHKFATARIAAGEPVRKYDQIIGFAAQDISPGEHVHTHNVEMKTFERDYRACETAKPVDYVADAERATFDGIVRPNGRIATRNYIGVLTTVNCSASVARYIADHFRGPALDAFANVDGVVALCHGTGCGMAADGEGLALLRRTLAGYARHPNFGGILFVGLGCEVAQLKLLAQASGFEAGPLLQMLTIQEAGGSRATVREGIARIERMLPLADEVTREPVPASHLTLGLECGGSDAYSGISANPALGAAVDLLVRHGGSAVLGETPEIYGAEHLLTRRAVSPEVAGKLIERIRWWEDYTARNGGEMNNNPTPGNKAGGLTTILEKSLGAAAKGGTTNLVDVYGYAEPVTAKGFVFMDTPGYDPVSVTGMVAGGANIVCFTTGRGSVFGCKPVPSLKLATNSALFERMADDMDINCGAVIDDGVSLEALGAEIFGLILETASGRKTKSEELGIGDSEFVPWQLGAVM
jgi:altronate hydrolase